MFRICTMCTMALAASVSACLPALAADAAASSPSAMFPFDGRMVLTAPLMLSRTPEPSKVSACQVRKGTRVHVLKQVQSALKVEEQQFNVVVLEGRCKGLKGFTGIENVVPISPRSIAHAASR